MYIGSRFVFFLRCTLLSFGVTVQCGVRRTRFDVAVSAVGSRDCKAAGRRVYVRRGALDRVWLMRAWNTGLDGSQMTTQGAQGTRDGSGVGRDRVGRRLYRFAGVLRTFIADAGVGATGR